MFKLIAPRDLDPIPAVAAAAFVALAIFAWTERTGVLDPVGLSVPYWPWKLWQIGPLLMGFGGVWWVWLSTRRVPWVRNLALGIVALAVLANGYSDLFGNYRGDVWANRQPSVHRFLQRGCGGSVGAADALRGAWARWFRRRLGALVFANAYFVNNGVIWQILDPARMLTALAWAAGASHANIATPQSS